MRISLIALLLIGCTPLSQRPPEYFNVRVTPGWKPLDCKVEYVPTSEAKGRCNNLGIFDPWAWGCVEMVDGEWRAVVIHPDWQEPSEYVERHELWHCEVGPDHVKGWEYDI